MVSWAGHYADHDFTAHAHDSWTPRSGFVQPAFRVFIDADAFDRRQEGGGGEGVPFFVQHVHDSRRYNTAA